MPGGAAPRIEVQGFQNECHSVHPVARAHHDS